MSLLYTHFRFLGAGDFALLPGLETRRRFRKWRYWPNSIHAQRLLILMDRCASVQ